MFELVKAGGWLMLPIIICSIAAVAICLDRFLALNPDKMPVYLEKSVIINRQWCDPLSVRSTNRNSLV